MKGTIIVKIDLPGSPEIAQMIREALRVQALVDEPVYFDWNKVPMVSVYFGDTLHSVYRRYLERLSHGRT